MVADAIPPYDLDAFERLDAILAEREEVALAGGRRALASDRYLRLLDVLVDAAREPVVSPAASASCSKTLPPLVRGAWDKLAKRARKLDARRPRTTSGTRRVSRPSRRATRPKR